MKMDPQWDIQQEFFIFDARCNIIRAMDFDRRFNLLYMKVVIDQ